MRLLPLLLLVAACASHKAPEAKLARWEIDGDGSYAVALCPECGEPVADNGSKCAACGADYRVEALTVTCPDCQGTDHVKPRCDACEDTGRCAICDGTGTFEGANCPECEGKKHCPDCAHNPSRTCTNCGGKGKVTVP